MPSPSTPRREALYFWGLLAFLWVFFAIICSYSSILLDDWYQVIYWKRHEFTLGAIWDNAVYNYLHYNPRLGENFLLIVNGPRWIYLVMTPTVEILLLVAMFACSFGRWPRADKADTRRMFVMLVVLWMVAPVPGIMWFYRPFNTNYVYGFLLTMLLCAPYAIEIWRPKLVYRDRFLAPGLFVLGVAAGLTNEHTGPTAIVAIAVLCVALWRKHKRVRPWMIAGLLGICIGYPLLYFAPGQSERYGGLATKVGPLDVIKERGAGGTLDVLRGFIWEGQLAIYIIAGALLLFARRARDGSPMPPGPDRRQVTTAAFLIVTSFMIVATLFASPTWGERLFFAPSVLFAGALVILCDVLMQSRAARRLILGACVVTFAYHAIRLVMVYPKEYAENEERLEEFRKTPAGGVAYVEPYTNGRSPWMNADDFGYASLREEVAHEYSHISGIEFDRVVRMEPSPPYKMELEYVMDPPMAKADVEKQVVFPLSFVPSYVDRDVQLVRRIVPQLRAIPGHELKDVVVHVKGFDFPELRGRPLLGLRWHDDKFDLIDVRRYFDDQGMLYWLVWNESLPPDVDDSYIVSCGEVRRLPLTRDDRTDGWRMTFNYTCRGLYVMVVCTKKECWLATTAYR